MLTGSSDSLRWLVTGAGDAERWFRISSKESVRLATGKGLPHISQTCNEGWLWNVHREQTSVGGSDEKLCRL